MTDRKQTKRAAPISYRPPEAVREEFMRRAADSGLSMNAFITAAVMECKLPRRKASSGPASDISAKNMAQLLMQCAAIRDQLARIEAGFPGAYGLLEDMNTQLSEVRSALFKALGREP